MAKTTEVGNEDVTWEDSLQPDVVNIDTIKGEVDSVYDFHSNRNIFHFGDFYYKTDE